MIQAEEITSYCAGAVILNDKDQILLLMRDDMPTWTNVGGNSDPGEDLEPPCAAK
ncbi:MAG: hypothetical protein JWM96_678 [Alphaproteobacteria bacterium]|nr:hypothetical protein [Alphaproteobacteria bacterium]